jgi:adenylate cyclase
MPLLQFVDGLIFRRLIARVGDLSPEETWHLLLSGQDPTMRRYRNALRLIPQSPRCKFCNAPFEGPGAPLMRAIGRAPSSLNPRFCNVCLNSTPVGGTEIELSMLFADVRGSTGLAERMSATDFGQLISRYYTAATDVLTRTDALIDKLIGDQVSGLYFPGFAGHDHARAAVRAAGELLEATGHADPGGPWIPVGIGVVTDTAFVGKVGGEGVTDVTVLGDAANVCARLASLAGPGEALISEAASLAAGFNADELEERQLMLKGRTQPVNVRVLAVAPATVRG